MTRIQRLSASTFRLTSAGGRVIIVDPWLVDDPLWPLEERAPEKLARTDVICVTHGHFDHLNGAMEIWKLNQRIIVLAQWELAMRLLGDGVTNVRPMNIGGTLDIDGIKYSMVNAAHTSSVVDPASGRSETVGSAAGFVIGMEDGFKVCCTGDTGLHTDMKLVGDYFHPDLAILPVAGAGIVMGPEEAVYATTVFLRPRYVIPFHDFCEPSEAAIPEGMAAMFDHLPQGRLTLGTRERFAQLMEKHPDIRVLSLAVGESVEVG